ncbi:MAG: tonB-system energizer ExbB, partial [Nitrobacter sp.]
MALLPSAMVHAQQQDSLSAAQPRAASGGAPSASDTSAPAVSSSVSASTLPRDLSPWGMFMQADIIVKAVMIGLAFASLVTWTIWFAKGVELAAARRRALGCVRKLTRAPTLDAARAEI